MTVRMLFFAHLQDVAGNHEMALALPDGATIETVAAALAEQNSGFARLLSHSRVAVNAEFAEANTLLHEGDEVAWMPPMSGGTPDNLPMLTQGAIDLAGLSRMVEASGYGAVVTFAGNVRDNARGRSVLYLEYEGYPPLAEKQLQKLVTEAETRWGVKCAVQHRLGRLEIGECSVGVAVAAAHRGEAFEACRWLMDTLKETVPIWKREFFEGGDHWVEGPNTISTATEDF
ncbi:MAG: molybdenum cofactor biosynthesis protein [Janthinobacterium lividum]